MPPNLTPAYRVNDVYPTVQGEGVQTGVPMVLVRLMGCPVACHFCDTKETWVAHESERDATVRDALGTSPRWALCGPADLVAEVDRQRAGAAIRWVLVTGGEPAEQDLGPLVAALHAAGYRVAIETSGTARGHLGAGFDHVCVSPKWDNPGGRPVHLDVVDAADEVKAVIGKDADLAVLHTYVAGMRTRLEDATRAALRRAPDHDPVPRAPTICVQPMSASPRATELCVNAALAHGYRLSIQTHKTAGVR